MKLFSVPTLATRFMPGVLIPLLSFSFSCPSHQAEVVFLSEQKASLQQHLDASNSTVAILQSEKSKLQQELAESKKEQDDLLVLLADQDQKIIALKNKLQELGEPVRCTRLRNVSL